MFNHSECWIYFFFSTRQKHGRSDGLRIRCDDPSETHLDANNESDRKMKKANGRTERLPVHRVGFLLLPILGKRGNLIHNPYVENHR